MAVITVNMNFANVAYNGTTYGGLSNMGGFMWSQGATGVQWNEATQSSALWYGTDFTTSGTGPGRWAVTGGTLTHTWSNFRPGYDVYEWTGMSESAAAIYNAVSTNNFAALDALFADDTFIYTVTGEPAAINNTFHGNAGDDQLYGGAAPDVLEGWGGNDILSGGAGNASGFNNDTLNGGDGFDTALVWFDRTAAFTISGTPGDMTIVGPDGTDRLISIEQIQFADGSYWTPAELISGDDYAASWATTGNLLATSAMGGRINYNGDHDWIRVNLGAGFEYTFLGYGGTLGNITLTLRDANGAVLASNDDFNGANSQIVFTAPATTSYYLDVGASGNVGTGTYQIGVGYTQAPLFDAVPNYVNLPAAGGAWHGQAGNDVVLGSAGTDIVFGEDGYDNIYGSTGNDMILGGINEDVLVGDAGNDVLDGGDGGDVLSELAVGAASGNDIFYGGSGVDIMYSGAGNDVVYGGGDAANNYGNLGDGNDVYYGAMGTDVVVAGAGNDTISGGLGDDSLYGEAGNDVIYGGAGIDLLSGSTGNDTLDAGDNNDLLVGDEGNDILLGGGGVDVLYGFADNDILNGGTGGDVDGLFGGAGYDSFQVGGAGYGTDYIWDFQGGAGTSDRLLVAAGVTIASQYTSSGNYYFNFSNGSVAVVVEHTSVLAEDVVLNGF